MAQKRDITWWLFLEQLYCKKKRKKHCKLCDTELLQSEPILKKSMTNLFLKEPSVKSDERDFQDFRITQYSLCSLLYSPMRNLGLVYSRFRFVRTRTEA
jgi:hypothetical protein